MKNQNDPNSSSVKKYVILDTNILFRASARDDGNKNAVGDEIIGHLRFLFNKSPEYDLAVSGATLFEQIDGKSLQDEIRYQTAINGMEIFEVNNEVLRLAGRLGCFYRDLGINDSQISMVDKIVAATALLTGSIIHTTDMRDYPTPFFTELSGIRKIVEYKSKGTLVYLPIYFMAPDSTILVKYFNQRILPSTEGKTQKLFELSPIKQMLLNRAPEPMSAELDETVKIEDGKKDEIKTT